MIGLFSAVLSPGENCDFSHLPGTSCPIDYLCRGSDFACGICNTNSKYWYLFFFFFQRKTFSNKSSLERLSDSALKARHKCSLSSRATSYRQKYQQEQVSIN